MAAPETTPVIVGVGELTDRAVDAKAALETARIRAETRSEIAG